jgi:ornithine carbamoyltransferase
MIRTDDPAKLEEIAKYASVPVINGLTDHSHPCQIVADLLTALEKGVQLPGSKWAWLGDGNNVLHSIVEAAGLFGFSVAAGCPEGYDPDESFVAEANARLAGSNARVTIERDPARAAADADVVVTDTWVSMGQADSAQKVAAMTPYQVNAGLMAHARPSATFLHCLPAHRGEEVEAAVIDGPSSAVWDQAANRLPTEQAVLHALITGRWS